MPSFEKASDSMVLWVELMVLGLPRLSTEQSLTVPVVHVHVHVHV